MELIKKHWKLILGAVVVGALIVLSFTLDKHAPSDTATTTPISNQIPGVSITGDATVKEVDVSAVTQPSLDRPLDFSKSTLSVEVQAAFKNKIADIVEAIKKTPNDLSLWLNLGIYRKQAGDYEGARQAWVYVSEVAPTDPISTEDLADLYMNFIKDYPKAENYYTLAIQKQPTNIDNYRNLYTLYTFLYKTNTSAATDVIALGLKNNPGNPDLLALQAQHSGK